MKNCRQRNHVNVFLFGSNVGEATNGLTTARKDSKASEVPSTLPRHTSGQKKPRSFAAWDHSALSTLTNIT